MPQRTPLVTHSITRVLEYLLICDSRVLDDDGNIVSESDDQGLFLNGSGLKDPTEGETNITSITPFHLLAQVNDGKGLVSSDDIRGNTSGRDVREGDDAQGCQTPNRNDNCCILVRRVQDRRQVGSGVAMRNVYPGYFSKMVMAHEMGHYFGLCHIGHNGFQNLMFSAFTDTSFLDWGLFGYYLNAEPYFTSRDKRNVWRFIVDQVGNEL